MKAALFIIPILVLLVGCSQKEDLQSSVELEPAKKAVEREYDTSVRTNRMTRAAFFQQIYLPAYEKVGRKDPKWDEPVKRWFSALSESAGRETNSTEQSEELSRLMKEVEATGCEDPLARYMILKNTEDPYHAHEAGTNKWLEAAHNLDASGYHQYWKFWSYARAAQALKSASPKTNSPAVVKSRGDTSMRLIELVKDFSLPTSVVYETVHNWMMSDLGAAPKLRAWTFEELEAALLQGWGDTAEAQFIRGHFHVKYAWDGRGSGWANTVTDEGWKLFKERLGIARECLERAWIIKPMEEIALAMLTVELGDSTGRRGMERWFANAMELNPASYSACDQKLYWLMPKWHGSEEEVIAFGKECVTNRNGQIPLLLYHAHRQLAAYKKSTGGVEAEEKYWKRRGVWPDVKRSFETFFELHPDAIGWRHDYAMAAYKCEKWEDILKQVKLFGPINYSYFGGREAFEEMVRKAEANARL